MIVAHKETVLSSMDGMVVTRLKGSYEEADTEIVLHATDAAGRSATKIEIQSPDTDVLVLCVRRFDSLIPNTNFDTGTETSRSFISIANNTLGERIAAALTRFHSFSGCDQTGQFAGKSNLVCWKTTKLHLIR